MNGSIRAFSLLVTERAYLNLVLGKNKHVILTSNGNYHKNRSLENHHHRSPNLLGICQ